LPGAEGGVEERLRALARRLAFDPRRVRGVASGDPVLVYRGRRPGVPREDDLGGFVHIARYKGELEGGNLAVTPAPEPEFVSVVGRDDLVRMVKVSPRELASLYATGDRVRARVGETIESCEVVLAAGDLVVVEKPDGGRYCCRAERVALPAPVALTSRGAPRLLAGSIARARGELARRRRLHEKPAGGAPRT
jgi:hypothetical protein